MKLDNNHTRFWSDIQWVSQSFYFLQFLLVDLEMFLNNDAL